MGDVSFHLDGRTFTFEQPLPKRLRSAFSQCVNAAADLTDLDKAAVTLDVHGVASTFTIAATPALRSTTGPPAYFCHAASLVQGGRRFGSHNCCFTKLTFSPETCGSFVLKRFT